MADRVSGPHLVGVSLAFILSAVDPPDDASAPDRYARSSAAQRERVDADGVADRDRRWLEELRSPTPAVSHHAFRCIVDEYDAGLTRFAYSLVKSADAANDLVQDVFLRVWERREVLGLEGSFRSYLFTAVRHAALNFHRRQDIEFRYQESTIQDLSKWTPSTADDQIEIDAVAEAVRSALGRLSERRRTALHLRYDEELPFAVLAEVLGISPDAAQQLVHRAVKELRGYLGV